MGLPPMAGEGLEEAVGDGVWHALGAPPQELQLDFCLPTGQSFRWRRTGDNEYTGVIGDRLVCLRQLPDDVRYRVLARGRDASPADDAAALRDYFNLDTQLSQLATGWAASCSRFRDVSPHFPGARMLRQDPLECLFQFICSSNNHISRIHGMVERLCSSYGTPLESTTAVAGPGHAPATAPQPPFAPATAPGVGPEEPPGAVPKTKRRRGSKEAAAAAAAAAGNGGEATAAAAGGGGNNGLSYYAFPTLEQLSRATEEELRAAGFGYRARFIVGTTRALLSKPGGGRTWLLGLRRVGLEEAVQALTELPGIGPKVAACICLFSLDKHSAIPVDTHVWQIAVRHYCPQLAGRSLTKAVHGEVQRVFVERFGPYAGWAHNTLFISELASQQHRLPEHLRQAREKGKTTGKGKAGKAAAAGTTTGGGRRRGRSQDPVGGDSDGDSDAAAEAEREASSGGEDDGSDGCGSGGGDNVGDRTAARRSTRGGGGGGGAAPAVPPATATAAAAARGLGPGSSKRAGAGRARKAAAAGGAAAAVGAAAEVEAAVAAAAVAVGSAAGTQSTGSSEGTGAAAAGPACAAAVVEGQADADFGSPPAPAPAPAPAHAAGRLRARGTATAAAATRGPEPAHSVAPGAGRDKKRAASKAVGVPAAKAQARAQAAAEYGLNEFDDLAT